MKHFTNSTLTEQEPLKRFLRSQEQSLQSLHLKLHKHLPSEACIGLLRDIFNGDILTKLKNLTVEFKNFPSSPFGSKVLNINRKFKKIKCIISNTTNISKSWHSVLDNLPQSAQKLEIELEKVKLENLARFKEDFLTNITVLKCSETSTFNVCALLHLCPNIRYLDTSETDLITCEPFTLSKDVYSSSCLKFVSVNVKKSDEKSFHDFFTDLFYLSEKIGSNLFTKEKLEAMKREHFANNLSQKSPKMKLKAKFCKGKILKQTEIGNANHLYVRANKDWYHYETHRLDLFPMK